MKKARKNAEAVTQPCLFRSPRPPTGGRLGVALQAASSSRYLISSTPSLVLQAYARWLIDFFLLISCVNGLRAFLPAGLHGATNLSSRAHPDCYHLYALQTALGWSLSSPVSLMTFDFSSAARSCSSFVLGATERAGGRASLSICRGCT